jgi:hypothetical protein
MRLKSQPPLPQRSHGRDRLFCCPLRASGIGRFVRAAMAPTPFRPATSLARRGRFSFFTQRNRHAQ